MEFRDNVNWNSNFLFIICIVQAQRQLKSWDEKKKCYSTSLLTNPDHPVFSLHSVPWGDGERRKQDKQRRREGEMDGVGKTASNRKENRLRQEQKWREGEDWNNRKHKELEANFLWFPPVSNFSSLCKSVCRFGYLILSVWPAQMSQLLFREINLELDGFNFYNDRLVAFDISGSCSSKPSTKSKYSSRVALGTP